MAKEEKVIDYNALGQAIDTTWGRSSTPGGAGSSIKMKILGPKLMEVCFVAVVNLVNDREMVDLKKRYVSEANETIGVVTKRVKENYKEETGETIALKQESENDSFEIINLNIYNRKRTAYFRRRIVYTLS